jgi:stage V sporulation protein G
MRDGRGFVGERSPARRHRPDAGSVVLQITEIRIKIVPGTRDKLRGFASVTLADALVVRDIKIIEGGEGLFVAMPSRKLCDRCERCGGKNSIRARFCNDCGGRLAGDRAHLDERGRPRLYADIAHPINQSSRGAISDAILSAYAQEFEYSQQEGYVATEFKDMDYDSWGEYTAG